jgi:energy-coupling factor transporter ATP-binding protein EcfA2
MRAPPPRLPRENPFRSGKVGALAFVGPTVEEALSRWTEQGRRGALVGPCGSGKSTYLRAIEAALAATGAPTRAWWLNAETRSRDRRARVRELRTLDPATVLLIDGAEQLGRLDGSRVRRGSRRLAGLWITTHRPTRLPTIHHHGTDRALASRLIGELDPSWLAEEGAQARLDALLRHHRGNLRHLFHQLYLEQCLPSGVSPEVGVPSSP